MAKVRDNIVTEGLSGKLGKRLVFRRSRGGNTLLALSPVFSEDRVYNDSQLAHQDAFRQAIAYAQGAKDAPVYVSKAEGTEMTSYNVAVADWFGQPQVLMITSDNWTGEIGQIIRVQAKDNVNVERVRLVIDNGQGTILEQGEAVRAEGWWWIYTTKTQMSLSPMPRIVATAFDLAGNSNGLIWQDN